MNVNRTELLTDYNEFDIDVQYTGLELTFKILSLLTKKIIEK